MAPSLSAALPVIVGAHSWKTGWMILGTLGFVMAVMNFLMIRYHPGEPSILNGTRLERHSREPISVIYLKLLRDLRFWLIGLAYLLTGFAIIIPFTFLTTYASQELALRYEMAAGQITVVGISAVIGKIALGSLSDKIRSINIMMVCALLIAGGSLGMAYG